MSRFVHYCERSAQYKCFRTHNRTLVLEDPDAVNINPHFFIKVAQGTENLFSVSFFGSFSIDPTGMRSDLL